MSQSPIQKDPWQRRKNLFSTSAPKQAPNQNFKMRAISILWVALKRTCTFIGAALLISTLLIYFNLSNVVDEVDHSLPNKMVLHLKLDGVMSESSQKPDFTDPFAPEAVTMKKFIDAIERAKYDPRVKGIYADLDSAGYSLDHLMEMRAAIEDFKKSGKFTFVYSVSYNEGLGSYYLARAFDQVWMQPMGTVNLTGISLQIPYFRNVLDKIGIEPNFYQRKEYKAAYESFTNKQMSKSNREAMSAIVDDLSSVISSQLASDLKMSEAEFKTLVDQAVFLDNEALEIGLVNKLAYADEIADRVGSFVNAERDGKQFYVSLAKYVAEMDEGKKYDVHVMRPGAHKRPSFDKQIALINVEGQIIQDDSDAGAGMIGANTISKALRAAEMNEKIAAVVLRVNSPGGSPVASETILRAIERVQKADKPVIVSMGAMAASGGYWISAYADHIFAQPVTLTGSIGVLGGKVSAQGLMQELGINMEYVNWGENAAMWTYARPFSPSEEKQISKLLDNIYDGFTQRVAKGRSLDAKAVEKIARGRPWTGKAAVEIGLVDELGGLNAALDYAAKEIGLEDRFGANIVVLPRPLSKFEQLIELLESQVSVSIKLQSFMQSITPLVPVVKQVMPLAQSEDPVQAYTPIQVVH